MARGSYKLRQQANKAAGFIGVLMGYLTYLWFDASFIPAEISFLGNTYDGTAIGWLFKILLMLGVGFGSAYMTKKALKA